MSGPDPIKRSYEEKRLHYLEAGFDHALAVSRA
jgi:hypothetical protein